MRGVMSQVNYACIDCRRPLFIYKGEPQVHLDPLRIASIDDKPPFIVINGWDYATGADSYGNISHHHYQDTFAWCDYCERYRFPIEETKWEEKYIRDFWENKKKELEDKPKEEVK